MKRKIALLLACFMVLAIVPVFASGGHVTPRIPIAAEGTLVQYYEGYLGSGTDFELSKDVVVGQRFTVSGRLSAVYTWCPSYNDNIGSITFKLYQWKDSYMKTIATAPILEETYVNFSDNAKITLNVYGNYTGEFLVTASNPVQRVAVWTNPANLKMSKTDLLYINGVVQDGLAMNIQAIDTPIEKADISQSPVDAYSPIAMGEPHASSNMSFGTYNEAKYAKVSQEEIGYLAYNVDFGKESPKGASLTVQNEVYDTAKVQVIADDPTSGPVICEFYAEQGVDIVMQTLTSKMHQKITGEHTIYVVYQCQEAGLQLFDLTFCKEQPQASWDEQRLAEFEATGDFTLTDMYSDTWAGNDLLGRKLIDHEKAGDFNPDKQVGMFYWTITNSKTRYSEYSINQRVIDSYNGPESDIKNNYNYKGWKPYGVWNESVYGYYNNYDRWVIRKHLEQLSAAGVDVLVSDTTNGTRVYTGGYMELADVMHEMHLEGTPTPGIAFMLPFFDMGYNVTDLERLYESMYSIGLYSDTWYYWENKPLVIGYPDNLVKNAKNAEQKAQHEEILEFFTFRAPQPDYRKGPSRADHWPWLEVYPQHPYGESKKYGCECVSVGVAQNSSDTGLTAMNGENVYGRSFTYKDRFNKLSPTSKYYGYNFIEQWDRALELNPEFVFITGWNELGANLHEKWEGVKGAWPDQYNDEYSRDIEPTQGEFKDTYYLLLANKIREFKGVRPTPTASKAKTIDLSAGFDQWADVGPEYFGFAGGVEPRDFVNRQKVVTYTNYTGRNDIILSKVARDSENMYFYVQTADDLTPHTDDNWMRLFINTDRKYKTGWEGYDFIINRVSPTEDKAVLEKWVGKNIDDWKFEKVADVDYTYAGNQMMIKIPKSLLKLGDKMDIEFKWNDNMQSQGDIMDFYVNGDTAPISRFAYRYVDEASVKNQVSDEPVDPAKTLHHATRRFIVMAIGSNEAYVYGQKTPIDTVSDVTAPVIVNGKTLLPVRFLAESLGAKVEWVEETQEIRIMGEKRIFLNLGSNIMRIEKEKRTLQTPAMEIEGRTYVPLRDIVEALNINCYWVEPGLILCGTEEAYIESIASGGIDRLLVKYNLIPDLS